MAIPSWIDRQVERENTFNIINNADGTITLIPVTGTIFEAGTPLNAANLNKINEEIIKKVSKDGVKGLSTYDYNDVEKGKTTSAINKATEALLKAQNPLNAILSAGYRVKPTDCDDELLSLINGGTINIGQGILVNKDQEHPLVRKTINGVLDPTMNSFVKKVVLDVQVLNAKEGKTYQLNWLGNGYANFGENAKYGFQIAEYDTSTMGTSTESMRTQVAYTDYQFDTPVGITTRMLKGRYDNVIFIVTIDYNEFGANTFLSTTAFGTSVIHPSKYMYTLADTKSIALNKSTDYPFHKLIVAEPSLHADILKGILDIKIINARPGKIYKIEWLGNGTTAWGSPEYSIYLNEYDESDTDLSSGRVVFDRYNAHLDAPENIVETRLIYSDGEDISMSITVDYSKLRYDRYPMNSINGAGKGHIVDKACYLIANKKTVIPNIGDTTYDLAISYDAEQDIKIKQKYSEGKNIVIEFGQLGINKLTHFKKVAYKIEDKISNDFSALEYKYDILSDWLSPYGMKATTNTVDTSAITVGGNHGTNSGSGFPTASHISTEVYVDGNKVKVGSVLYAKNCIEIIAKHNISASNVIDKSTGAKRNSAIETVLYKIYKDTIYVTVNLEASEDIVLSRYCGLQMTAPPLSMQNKLYFMLENGFNDYLLTDYTGREIPSCLKNEGELDRFNYYGENDMVVCYRDKHVGIADFRHIKDGDFPIYKSSSTKVYMHNISQKQPVNVPLSKGESLYWGGGYTFSSQGLKCDGVKKAYTIREKDKRVYCIDFDKATPITYLETYIEDRGKFITIINKSPNINCDNFINPKGLQVSSTGFGQLKFMVD